MTDRFLEETTALLARTPRVLRELLDGLPEAWLEGRDTPDGLQPPDVVGHLISAEVDDWIPRAEMIMEHGPDRPFEPFDRFAPVDRDRDVPMPALLARFAELRAEKVDRLRELVTDAGPRPHRPPPNPRRRDDAAASRDIGRARP